MPQRLWLAGQRRLPQLLLLSAAVSLASWMAAERLSRQAEVHFSYLISLSEREAHDAYRFDGYYALSAVNLFSETLAEWVRRPEVVAEAAARAGVGGVPREARALQRLVAAEQAAPQLVAVTVRAGESDSTERLARSLQAVVAENLERYHESGTPALRFRVVASEMWAGQRTVAANVVAAAAFLFTLFAAVNLLIVWESLR